jgi:hypothetical protein
MCHLPPPNLPPLSQKRNKQNLIKIPEASIYLDDFSLRYFRMVFKFVGHISSVKKHRIVNVYGFELGGVRLFKGRPPSVVLVNRTNTISWRCQSGLAVTTSIFKPCTFHKFTAKPKRSVVYYIMFLFSRSTCCSQCCQFLVAVSVTVFW